MKEDFSTRPATRIHNVRSNCSCSLSDRRSCECCLIHGRYRHTSFHLLTKWKVPVFLGSSFACIAPINAVILYHAVPEIYESVPEAIAAGFSITPDMIAYATGGILIAGLVQVAIAMLIKRLGVSMFEKIFPRRCGNDHCSHSVQISLDCDKHGKVRTGVVASYLWERPFCQALRKRVLRD